MNVTIRPQPQDEMQARNAQPQEEMQARAARPWWKEPYVWMVIAGPLSAVVACAITAVYIFQGPDRVISEEQYREGLAIRQQVQTAAPAMQPALLGRNHSATGGPAHVKP
jgi:hypothetical protein